MRNLVLPAIVETQLGQKETVLKHLVNVRANHHQRWSWKKLERRQISANIPAKSRHFCGVVNIHIGLSLLQAIYCSIHMLSIILYPSSIQVGSAMWILWYWWWCSSISHSQPLQVLRGWAFSRLLAELNLGNLIRTFLPEPRMTVNDHLKW